ETGQGLWLDRTAGDTLFRKRWAGTPQLPRGGIHGGGTVPRPRGTGPAITGYLGEIMSSSNSRLISVALALAVASGAGGFALYQKLNQVTADGSEPARLHDGVPE